MYECSKDLEPYRCKCLKFQTPSFTHLQAHIRADHKPKVPDEYVYKCTHCEFESYSKYVSFWHCFFAKCVTKTKSIEENQINKEHKYAKSKFTEECPNEKYPSCCNTSTVMCLNTLRWKYKKQFTSIRCPSVRIKKPRRKTSLLIQRQFKCENCGCIFKYKRSLECHILSYHKTATDQIKKEHSYAEKAKCRENSPANYSTSPVNMFDENTINCQSCPSVFCSFAQLQQHCNSCNEEFKCKKCPSRFKYRHSLKSHMSSYHKNPEDIRDTESASIQWFQCEHCPYKSSVKGNFKKHISVLHVKPEDIQWFQCDKCPKKFRRKSALQTHVIGKHTNPDEIPFHCKKCAFKTTLRNNLIKHVIEYHIKKNSYLRCDKCALKFKHESSLALHVKDCCKSADIHWFECEFCPAKYKYKGGLKTHVVRHHSTLPT